VVIGLRLGWDNFTLSQWIGGKVERVLAAPKCLWHYKIGRFDTSFDPKMRALPRA